MPQTAPFVFLSHSGADTAAAQELKRRLEAAPDARAAGLKVWFDKHDLRPGTPWSAQIAHAIQQESTAFVVYVGSGGVMNWVEAEVDLAISRVTTSKPNPLLFIPALAAESKGSAALPPFAKRYQGVRDPLGDSDELTKLLKAVVNLDWDARPIVIDEPFVGLRSMREEEADHFFGRGEEVQDLVAKFRKHRIVAIVADSGTGKSSLAQAGFIPAFRGGALIDSMREDAREKIWQVVTMRPGADPVGGLRQGVTEAAEKLGRSLEERASLRKEVSVDDAGATAYALQCGLPSAKTSTLLVVDQFEELFTASPNALQAPFVNLMLALAGGPSDVRVLMTVRADYFNLASGIKDPSGKSALFERLTGENNAAILRLKAMSAEGIKAAVRKPLRLAGEGDEAANAALLEAVQSDISHQASDLPLLQVALRAAWQERKATGRPMLECYQSVGRVSGALAREADKARDRLPQADQARLESIFVRLARLGDTGGATRRPASLDEFDSRQGALLQKLGSGEFGALVVVGETRAELSHEALITQWPWLQDMLKANAADVRRLERLMTKSREWSDAPAEGKTSSYLAFGAERDAFWDLANQHSDWLSAQDKEFLAKSIEWKAAEEQRDQEQKRNERRLNLFLRAAVLALVCAVAAAGWLAYTENASRRVAENALIAADVATKEARKNLSVSLSALAASEAEKHPVNAAKLAVAAWPRDSDDLRPKLADTLDALGQIAPNLRERRILKDSGRFAAFSPDGQRIVTGQGQFGAQVWDLSTGRTTKLTGSDFWTKFAAFSPDGTRVITVSGYGTVQVWDPVSGRALVALLTKEPYVHYAAFSPDGTRIVTAAINGDARVWDAASGRQVEMLVGHYGHVFSALFSPDGERIVTTSADKTARVWDARTGRNIAVLTGHGDEVDFAAFSPDGTRVVTVSRDKTARLWDASSGSALATLAGHTNSVTSAAFSPDGARIVTASTDETARLWNGATGRALRTFAGHQGAVLTAEFRPDGLQVVTASKDGAARLWDTRSGRTVATLLGPESEIVSATFNGDSTEIITASNDGTTRLWDATLGREQSLLIGHEGIVYSAAFSSDGARVVTASQDKTAREWEASSGREINKLAGHEDSVISAAFSPDRTRIVTASNDKTARIWDAASGRETAALRGHENSVYSAAFNQDGTRIVTASDDKTARIWDAASGREIAALRGHGSGVSSAAFSPDGTRIVTASVDRTARIWDAATGQTIVILAGHKAEVFSAVFSPDGTRVVTASEDKTARLWDAASGRLLATLVGHGGTVWSAAFSPDGTRIATASQDGTARIWDAASGRALATLAGHDGQVHSAAFSPDGTRVVTAAWDGAARIWDVSTIPKGNILQVACALLRMHESPVSLEGVTQHPLTFDRPICVTDPPPPDPLGETAPTEADGDRMARRHGYLLER